MIIECVADCSREDGIRIENPESLPDSYLNKKNLDFSDCPIPHNISKKLVCQQNQLNDSIQDQTLLFFKAIDIRPEYISKGDYKICNRCEGPIHKIVHKTEIYSEDVSCNSSVLSDFVIKRYEFPSVRIDQRRKKMLNKICDFNHKLLSKLIKKTISSQVVYKEKQIKSQISELIDRSTKYVTDDSVSSYIDDLAKKIVEIKLEKRLG